MANIASDAVIPVVGVVVGGSGAFLDHVSEDILGVRVLWLRAWIMPVSST
jgi:hypothetical protein